MRWVVAFTCAGLVVASQADAAVLSWTSATHAHVRLDGRVLDVEFHRLAPTVDGRVLVACGDNAARRSGLPVWARVTARVVRVRREQPTLRVRFASDVSRTANACGFAGLPGHPDLMVLMRLRRGSRPPCGPDGSEKVVGSDAEILVMETDAAPVDGTSPFAIRGCLRGHAKPRLLSAGIARRSGFAEQAFSLSGTRVAWTEQWWNHQQYHANLWMDDLGAPVSPARARTVNGFVTELAVSVRGALAWTVSSSTFFPDSSDVELHVLPLGGADAMLERAASKHAFAPAFSEDGSTLTWTGGDGQPRSTPAG